MAEQTDDTKVEVEDKDQVIAKLKEQNENLNKGIAATRDEAKSAKAEAVEAKAAAAQAAQKLSEIEALQDKKDDGVKLSAEDEKKLAAYAQKHGLVTKDDIEKQRSMAIAENFKAFENQAVAEFLEKHPEYDDDDKWKEITKEFNLFRAPTSLTGYKQLLERIHKDVSREAEKSAAAKARAEVINRSRLGIGGGSSGASDNDAEAELERLVKKYPNLSRELIIATKAELSTLLSKKK